MATTAALTVEALERLPEDERGEVIRGEMLPVSPRRPRPRHRGRLSLGNVARDPRKMLMYLNAGTPLVWVSHPARRTVAVYASDRTARIFTEGETLDGGEVLPGFTLPIAELVAA